MAANCFVLDLAYKPDVSFHDNETFWMCELFLLFASEVLLGHFSRFIRSFE